MYATFVGVKGYSGLARETSAYLSDYHAMAPRQLDQARNLDEQMLKRFQASTRL
jgi:hypothetical protein